MVTKELSEYIKAATDAGQTIEEIRAALLDVGWQEADIAEALSTAKPSPQTPAPAPSPTQTQTQPAANPWVASAHPTTANSPEHMANTIDSMPVQGTQTSPETQPSPAPNFSPITSQTKTPRRPGLIVAIVVAIVLLVGGGVFAAVALLPADPNKILAEAVTNSLASTSGKMNITFNAELTGDAAKGLQGTSASQPAKITATLDGSYETVASSTNTDVTLHGSFADFSADLSVRSIKDTAYIKIGELPSFVLLFFPPANNFVGKWISIDPQKLTGMANDTGLVSITATSSVADLTDTQKREALANNLAAITQKDMPLSVSQKLADEQIGSANAYHYQIGVDKDKLKALYTDITQEVQKEFPDAPGNTPQNIADNQAQFDKFLASDAFKSLAIEAWVSKPDHYLTQIKISGSFNPDTLSDTPSTFPTSDNPSNISITMTETLTDQEKPQDITAPTDATPIEDILTQLFTAKTMNDQTGVLQVMSSARAQAEIYYNTTGKFSYTGLCSDKDMAALFADAQKQTLSPVTCHTAVGTKDTKYAANIKLDSEVYFCIDSTGAATTTTTDTLSSGPTDTICN